MCKLGPPLAVLRDYSWWGLGTTCGAIDWAGLVAHKSSTLTSVLSWLTRCKYLIWKDAPLWKKGHLLQDAPCSWFILRKSSIQTSRNNIAIGIIFFMFNLHEESRRVSFWHIPSYILVRYKMESFQSWNIYKWKSSAGKSHVSPAGVDVRGPGFRKGPSPPDWFL